MSNAGLSQAPVARVLLDEEDAPLTTAHEPIVDEHGRPMFFCRDCRQPMSRDDFFDLGLRTPDRGESASDYCDAELIDDFQHPACLPSERAG